MVQKRDEDQDPEFQASRARLKRIIEEHIARGNKPDYERAQRSYARFLAGCAAAPPTGRTEEQARELIARYCPRRSFFR